MQPRRAWSLTDLLRLAVVVALLVLGVLLLVGVLGIADALGAALIVLGVGFATLW